MNSNTITRLLQTVKNDLKKFMSSDKNSITKELDRAFANGDKETSQVVSKLVGESFKDVVRMLALVDSALSLLQRGAEDYTRVEDLLKRVQFAAFDFYANWNVVVAQGPEAVQFVKSVKPVLERLYRIDRSVLDVRKEL